jgi:hypothetical protein
MQGKDYHWIPLHVIKNKTLAVTTKEKDLGNDHSFFEQIGTWNSLPEYLIRLINDLSFIQFKNEYWHTTWVTAIFGILVHMTS